MNTKELFDLTGRVAIITGGSVGLGRQMAEGLAEMGANLVLCARKKERCQEAAEELRKLGVRTLALGCDVKNPANVREVVDATISEFGRIDILVNNAGTSWGAPVEEMRLEHWNKVIETNLTGTFLFSQAPEFQAIGYHASKGGVIAFTYDLACKWGIHNIQVNAIAPGWFPTNMSHVVMERNKEAFLSKIPLRRFGSEHDLKGAAVFLSSGASDYVTGHVLVVDGGQTA